MNSDCCCFPLYIHHPQIDFRGQHSITSSDLTTDIATMPKMGNEAKAARGGPSAFLALSPTKGIAASRVVRRKRSRKFDHSSKSKFALVQLLTRLLTSAVSLVPRSLRNSIDTLKAKSLEALEKTKSRSRSKSTSSSSLSLRRFGASLTSLPGALRQRSGSASYTPSTYSASLISINEDEDPIPGFDRDFDISVDISTTTIQDCLDQALERLIPTWAPEHGPYPVKKLVKNSKKHGKASTCLWFKLPVKCKRMIYEYLFPDDPATTKISLVTRQFTIAVFPAEDHFIPVWDVLFEVWGALGSCKAWRNEVLAYLFTQYRFHITLNEFTMKFVTPLTCVWILPYLHLLERLTIERDFTRLAFNRAEGAAGLKDISYKVTPWFDLLIDGLMKREHDVPMTELRLWGRKYVGFRPIDQTPDSIDPGMYIHLILLSVANSNSTIRSTARREQLRQHCQAQRPLDTLPNIRLLVRIHQVDSSISLQGWNFSR